MKTAPPSNSKISSNLMGTRKLWSNVYSMMNEFGTRLLEEYLPTLRKHQKRPSTVDGIEIGNMVWIVENNTPRLIWPKGRVQKVIKGKNNVVRSCLVKKSRQKFVKPAPKLSSINDKST